jgi:hypothetical protein
MVQEARRGLSYANWVAMVPRKKDEFEVDCCLKVN